MTEYALVSPSDAALWDAFHEITRSVLFEARGQFGVYDPALSGDTTAGKHPKLLMFRGDPVGVMRIDLDGETAIFRRVAVRADAQRRGHGRVLQTLAEQFAKEHGCRRLTSHVATDASGFYKKCGFIVDALEAYSVLMSKRIPPTGEAR